jgi:hypothetical protein
MRGDCSLCWCSVSDDERWLFALLMFCEWWWEVTVRFFDVLWVMMRGDCSLCWCSVSDDERWLKQTETVMINHSTNINKANSHLSSSLIEHQQSEQSPLCWCSVSDDQRWLFALLMFCEWWWEVTVRFVDVLWVTMRTKRTVTSHHHSQNIKKDHVIWRWKSRSWSGTCPSGGV